MNKKILLVCLITVLIFCFCACNQNSPASKPEDSKANQTEHTITFQEYLWEEHAIDLTIQIGLMLAGALGVAALLPAPDEE